MLTDCPHHGDPLAPVSAQRVLNGLISWRPGFSIPHPQVKWCLVKVNQRLTNCDDLRKTDGEILNSGTLQRQWLLVGVAHCKESYIISPIESLKTFRGYLKIEVFFENHAALLEIVTTPFLEQITVQHFLGEFWSYLALRVILPLIEFAAINKLTSLSIALHRILNCVGTSRQNLGYFCVWHLALIPKLKSPLDVNLWNPTIDSASLLLFLDFSLLWRRR